VITIDEAIQVKKFKSEHHRLIVNIIYTNGWLNGKHVEWLKPFDISMQQYNVLRILRGTHPSPASINTIISRMLDKNSNASRLVEKLRQKGFIERTVCENDRRQVDVVITQKGLELLSLIDVEIVIFEKNFHSLTQAEAAELNRLLDKLRN